ncbi:MAG: exodeoxyribonuclease VII small subunit [Gemmatimonadales bacterium]|jgi:exodeoxyribonuclease VII small subunit
MTFEEDVARLEAIAAELGGDGVALDRALELFEEGVARLRRASAELVRVESQVALLVEQAEGVFKLRPMRDRGEGSVEGGSRSGRGSRP